MSECGWGKNNNNKNSATGFSFPPLLGILQPGPVWSGSVRFVLVVVSSVRCGDMANVADTKLYDILGVSPSATENELKKVAGVSRAFSDREGVWAGELS